MKGFIIAILITLALSIHGLSMGTPDSLVSMGNSAYNDANYKQAVEYYTSVIDRGFSSSDLYYNLANSYFKLNDIPSAILYYEKALKLDPKDEDINFNLSLANSRIIDKIEPVPELFLKKWWKQLLNLMSPDRWIWAGITLFIAFLFLLTVFIVTRSLALRRTAFWSGVVVLVVLLYAFYSGLHGYHNLKQEKEGIIFTPTVTVKSSPSENSVDLFVIHEGTKVRLMEKIEGWTEIKIANGSLGWVKNSDYKPV